MAGRKSGYTIKDNYGLWVMLDKGDDEVPNQVGNGLTVDYPAIARISLDELEASLEAPKGATNDVPLAEIEQAEADLPPFNTVADVLGFAREKIALLTGMPAETIKLDLRMGV